MKIVELFSDVAHAFQARMGSEVHLASTNLSHFPVRILAFIARTPGVQPRDIVVRSDRDKGQVGRAVRELQSHGLVEREKDTEDGRAYRLHLTHAGREMYDMLDARREKVVEEMVQHLDERERSLLIDLLTKMKSGLVAGAK